MEIGDNKTKNEMPDNGQDSGNSPGIVIETGTKKRGRPPGSKNSGTPIITGASITKSKPSVSPSPDQIEASKFIGVGFIALLELFESFVHSNGAKKIEKKMPDKLAEFRTMCLEVGLQDKEKDLIQDTVSRIAARHEFLTKYAPEVVLGVTLAQYSVRQIALMRFVDNNTKDKLEIKVTDKPAQVIAA